MIGSVEPSPSISRSIDVGQRERAVQHDAGERGEGAGRVGEQGGEQHLGAVGRDDDDRALGEPRQHVDHRHAGDDDAEHLAGEQLGVALDQASFDGAHDAADRRRDEEAVLGQGPDRAPHRRPRAGASRQRPPRSRRSTSVDARRDRRGWRRRRTGSRAAVRELGERERRRSAPSRSGVRGVADAELLALALQRRDRRARAAPARRGWRRSARCRRARPGCRHPCSRCRR